MIEQMIQDFEVSEVACHRILDALVRRLGYRDAVAAIRNAMTDELELYNSGPTDPQSGYADALAYEHSQLNQMLSRMENPNTAKWWLGEGA